jgi:ribosomal protein S18 acetylase RimI-like enzyme
MSWSIQPLPVDGPLFEGAIAVYRDAFARAPYNDRERAGEVRDRIVKDHAPREGFRAFAAFHRTGPVIGMIYGYHGGPGQWWHDSVRANISPELAEDWLADSYELVEVAVAPAYQSLGIGRVLIAQLLEDRPEATCLLSTRPDSDAHLLYRRLGFEVIKEMRFTKGGYPFYVMGKRLR